MGERRKRNRSYEDAQVEIEGLKGTLLQSNQHLARIARENARLRVLVKKYMDQDDSLLSSSQISLSQSQTQAEEQDKEFVTNEGEAGEEASVEFSQDDILPMSQLSDLGASQLSDLGPLSQLDEIVEFLGKQTESKEMENALEQKIQTLTKAHHVVRVGVGVLLQSSKSPGCILIGERKGSHGEGKLALPGGHLEKGESWQLCAQREIKEETDLDLSESDFEFAYVTNDFMEEEDKHYVTIFLRATVNVNPSQVKNLEPHKCEGWKWIEFTRLETSEFFERLFLPMQHLVQAKYSPF